MPCGRGMVVILSMEVMTIIMSFFPAHRQWYNQRIPGWAVGTGVSILGWLSGAESPFRNREEEESWLQWRRERTQRQEEEAGPSTRREKEAYPANTRVQKEDTSHTETNRGNRCKGGTYGWMEAKKVLQGLRTDRLDGVRKEFSPAVPIGNTHRRVFFSPSSGALLYVKSKVLPEISCSYKCVGVSGSAAPGEKTVTVQAYPLESH
ncbi:uncharacterized protein LOC121400500 [Xenopus laevis]|uniref:Uncharacterized protein LOC121400500 n=1 Tax=Xenopus laevis TaxID=8355 RepID=A0A8J1MEZ1_XENLA|nr:uncharacterized protein LOC121400500 [Xenopus laevis]